MGEIQPQHPAEDHLAHIGHDPLAQLIEEIHAKTGAGGQDQGDRHGGDEELDERALAAIREMAVDDPAHPIGHGQGRG